MTIRSTTTTGLAAVLAAALCTGAHAQSPDTDLTGQAKAAAQADAQARLEADVPLAPPPDTLAELVGTLSGDGVAVPMEDLPEGTTVETLLLGELPTDDSGSGNDAALDNALARAQTQLDMLQTRVDGDEVLTRALEDGGFSSDQVLGVYSVRDGTVALLIDDRA
ncbi:hypothetical protein AL036_10085 [Salipiger aestuarii]|uniref:Uncharacterized protein n=1 Tax=Salipiger aestuarii TaxID=568098 RepID=A0A327Y4R1_9RHOB|nr:hypothetical protein [Salipiger aestuarii]EIE49728.1 hypothetical protein C357_16908 [Citreicella sp. 357]KAA8607663.1 hypothetical protein AL036_10085 [Salipiger aestuarii]KAA8611123.1 hypothetical protein AL037_10690 [Salipiger aestuarii]KAB2541890.1 hypothetical protein AL035_10150 [Salipiger aestuarii]RAK15417.1 hypothetical protein ATI53_102360 [Salipiger aestuarii]